MNECLKYNIFQQHCPARLFFEKIADKWVLLILNILEHETQHFNLLKKNIEGISPKVLSQKLKMLERRFYRTKNSGYFPYSCRLFPHPTWAKCSCYGVSVKRVG